jgi:hypothetical protein
MGTIFVLENVTRIHILLGTNIWVLHDLHAVRHTSAKANTLPQTQQPVLMPVLDLDRVLLADSDTLLH